MRTVDQASLSDRPMNECCYDQNIEQVGETPNWVDEEKLCSLCERLENFRSHLFVGLKLPLQGYSTNLAPQSWSSRGRAYVND